MKILQKTFTLTGKEYYKQHLLIINPSFTNMLTVKEINVLASFMVLGKERIFSKENKKLVMTENGLSPGGLSNYMKILVDKGFLIKSAKNKYIIRPEVVAEDNGQYYRFKILKGKP